MRTSDMSDDAARATWESIKRRPEVAQLVRTDPVFQRFVRQLVERFGALEAIEINESVPPVIEERRKPASRAGSSR